MDLLMAKDVERREVLHLVVRDLFRAALIAVMDMQVMSHRLNGLPARHSAHEALVAVALDDGLSYRCGNGPAP